MPVGNRGIKIKYSSGIAPLVTSKEYKDLIADYRKRGSEAFPHILKLGGMAIDSSQNRNKWRVPLADLYEVANQLPGQPLMKDHDVEHVDSIIGKVEEAWVEEDKEGGGKVMWKGECIDENLIQKILLGYVKNNSIQISVPQAYCDNCVSHLGKKEEEASLDNLDFPCPRCGSIEMIARHPQTLEQSIVAIPAYEKAEISPFGFKAALDDIQERRLENARKVGMTFLKRSSKPDVSHLVFQAHSAIAKLELGVLEMELRLMASVSEDDDMGERCSQCGGPLEELGSLGSRTHYRCRNCGMDSSKGEEEIGRKGRKSPGVEHMLDRMGSEGAPETEIDGGRGEEIGRQRRQTPGERNLRQRMGVEGSPETEIENFPLAERSEEDEIKKMEEEIKRMEEDVMAATTV